MFTDATINLNVGAAPPEGSGQQPPVRQMGKPPPAPPESSSAPQVSRPEFSLAGAPRSIPALSFQRDASGEMYISVIDRESGKELRQIPPEELRQLAESLEKWTGNVFDAVA